MSDEEKRNVEILNNIKEYMQNSIDSGHHKFIYNDLDWDEKCVDIINAIDYFIERVDNQQKEIEEKNIAINKMSKDISHQLEEIEEKSTIIMAGAEKVKQLEKEIEKLKFNNHMVGKWNEYLDKDCISKDKIRERIKEIDGQGTFDAKIVLEHLLEEN